MRILHTSDWHLGKSLRSKSRLAEQKQFLDELCGVCARQNIDVVLVAGDIFDTFVPKSEAEELFFSALSSLSKICKVVCLSGNHDDGSRLCAPSPLAVLSNIYLVHAMDNSCLSGEGAEGGDGFLRLDIGGEMLNLALLPYPFFSGILGEAQGETNEQRVLSLIERCVKGFGEGVNIFASHLFVSGSEVAEERELGTAPVLPKGILPECDYVALGHIHKPQALSHSRHIFYSGSPLRYSFDDTTDKYFFVYDSGSKAVERIAISAGAELVTARVESFEQAEKVLDRGAGGYVRLIYCGAPLQLSEIKKIKSHPSFTDIIFEQAQAEVKKIFKAESSPADLFRAFYNSKMGEQPKDELTELFLSIFEDTE